VSQNVILFYLNFYFLLGVETPDVDVILNLAFKDFLCFFGFVLLLTENLLHLFNRNCTLDVNPLILDKVVLTHPKHNVDALDVFVCDETEASRFMGPLVLQNHDIINEAKLLKVVSEDVYG